MEKFKTGRTVMTRGFIALYGDPDDFKVQMLASMAAAPLLERHKSGDWGNLDRHDSAANDAAILPGQEDRILSSYTVQVGSKQHKVWIITEWHREETTILLPSDY